ncbi:hypothetical protein VCHENC02_2847, partial [Vibrio harveyi]|jgi:hypothetical protein
MDKS